MHPSEFPAQNPYYSAFAVNCLFHCRRISTSDPDLSLETHFLGEEQGLLSVWVSLYHLTVGQLTLTTRTLNACNIAKTDVCGHFVWYGKLDILRSL